MPTERLGGVGTTSYVPPSTQQSSIATGNQSAPNRVAMAIPLAVGVMADGKRLTQEFGVRTKDYLSYQVKRSPDLIWQTLTQLQGQSQAAGDSLQTQAQTLRQALPTVKSVGPSLPELLTLGEEAAPWSQIRSTGGKAYVETVKHNFGNAFRGNVHTQGLSLAQTLRQPKAATTFGGKLLNAVFTRPIQEFLATGKNVFNASLTGLGLGLMAWDVGRTGVRANRVARAEEDGTLGSRWNTFTTTTGAMGKRALKSGATWLAASVGFALGRGLSVQWGTKAVGSALPKLLLGVLGGASVATGANVVLDQVLPEKYR